MHHIYTLKNGFKIVLIPRKDSQICKINIHVNAGSIFDEKGFNNGTSHFVEHMIFNGTKKYPKKDDLLNLILNKGGARRASTSHFEQLHSVTISNEYIESALEYLSQTLLHPILTKKSFKKEKSIIQNELSINESSLDRFFYAKGVNKTIFKTKSLQNYPLGNYNSIESIKFEEVCLFHSTYFKVDRMTIFISGDFKNKEIINLCEKKFTQKKIGNSIETNTFLLEINKPKNANICFQGIKNKKISCSQFIPNINELEYLSMLFLIQVLCVGVRSRLFIELREKRTLIYDIYPNNMCIPQGLLVGIVTQTANENIAEIKKTILSEIKKISINSIKQEELSRIKNTYIQKIIEQNDSTIGICDTYSKYYRKFGAIYNAKSERNKVEMIGLDQIKNSAFKLMEKDMSWIIMS